MSASSGNPRLQVAADANDRNKRGRRDVEQGDLHTEKQRFSPNLEGSSPSNDGNPEDEDDEYIRLLKFIDLEAKKEKLRRDEDHGDDEDQEAQRLWYMPWKKVPVQSTSTKARKVPQDWLETDISQGLSLSEIDTRRARFGYNELERLVNQRLELRRECVLILHTVLESILFSSLLGISVAQFFLVRAATPPTPSPC
jgi:H+-transporting ATPase